MAYGKGWDIPLKNINVPEWVIAALAEIGETEIAGPGVNVRIGEYLETVGQMKDDAIPWCAAFVQCMLAEAGIFGTGEANAQSYLQWGDECKERLGAVAVFKRGTEPWQGHVCFLLDWDKDWLICLGGNQSDRVKISLYERDKLMGLRWPKIGATT
ncbi:TIGR02594 family protein [Gammaproteobacteria bacterium]